jgi:hypothetical protein
MYVLPKEKRRKKKGKKKQRQKEEWVGGRGPASGLYGVRLNGCLYGSYLTAVHCVQCTWYGLIAQLADHRYENFRLNEINDDDRLTTDMLRLDLGVCFNYLTNSTKLLFDASACTRALHPFSQPAARRTMLDETIESVLSR